jgi:hypothetical protein
MDNQVLITRDVRSIDVSTINIISNDQKTNQDIKNVWTDIYYYESVLQETIRTSVMYVDAGTSVEKDGKQKTILEGLPIVGQEKVLLKIKDANNIELKLTLYVNKITPVKQEIVKQDLTPTGTVKLPTDSDISIKVEKRGGKFAVDYFDVDEKSNLVPKTEIFDTADEADSFVKKRKDEGKFYGPSMTRRGVDSDVAKKVASKSSFSQYRKLGTGKEK